MIRKLHRFAGLELDVGESRLSREGEPVTLQPKVFEALCLFVERAGSLVTRDDLIGRLWPDVVVSEEAVTDLVRKLRRALGDDTKEPRFIQTVLKKGYRFLPEVSVVTAPAAPAPPAPPAPEPAPPAPEPAPPAPAAIREPVPAPRAGPPWIVIAALAAALLLAGTLVWLLRGRHPARARVVTHFSAAPRRLTFTVEREQEGSFSPDGTRLVFVANLPEEGQFDLYLMQVAGGNRVRLTHTRDDEYHPQFSPDGQDIVFGRLEERGPTLWLMSALGGSERLLTTGAWPTFSPRGDEIAFVRTSSDKPTQLLRRTLRGHETVVAELVGSVDSVAWSPDGETLAIVHAGRIEVVPAAGGAPRPVGATPDYLRSVSWDHDGQALICDGSSDGRASALWRVNLADGRREALLSSGGNGFHPMLSPDGRRLVFTHEEKQNQVWLAPAGAAPRLLPLKDNLECFDVSPDGTRMAYTDGDGPHGAVVEVRDLAGGDPRVVGEGSCPRFSPDGQRLAVLRGNAQHREPWTIDLGSGQARRIATIAADSQPAWAPSGRTIAFAGRDAGGAGLMVVEVSGEHQLAVAHGDFGAPAFSPDGRQLAASGRVRGEAGLFVVSSDGGEPRRLSGHHSYMAAPFWLADGSAVRVLDDERNHPTLATVGLSGSETAPPWSLGRAPDPSFWGVFELAPVASGGWLYVQQRYESDLFVLEAD